jgi:hypothetical protein
MITFEEAMENAARILKVAEGETNLAMQAGNVGVADSWIAMGVLLREHERV